MNGNFIFEFGKNGTELGKFDNPWGVAIDELGFIYVVDKVFFLFN